MFLNLNEKLFFLLPRQCFHVRANGETSRKDRKSQMFPQQNFLVYPGSEDRQYLNLWHVHQEVREAKAQEKIS